MIMKIHTTNYYNTFIEVAEDCPVDAGQVPLIRQNTESIANIQFELLSKNPYKYTSDDVLFQVFAKRNSLEERDHSEERKKLFSRGQPCLRSSPLTKRYGWGIHCNEEGKIALYGVEKDEYQKFLADVNIKKIKAMRSKRV